MISKIPFDVFNVHDLSDEVFGVCLKFGQEVTDVMDQDSTEEEIWQESCRIWLQMYRKWSPFLKMLERWRRNFRSLGRSLYLKSGKSGKM